MSFLEIGAAIDLFMTLFELSIWAVGIICFVYLIKIVQVMMKQVSSIRIRFSNQKARRTRKVKQA